MTTPSAIAREIAAYCDLYTHMTITREELLDKITELVPQDARQPVAIDEAGLRDDAAKAAFHYHHTERCWSIVEGEFKNGPKHIARGGFYDGYKAGFRECARRNAAVVSWPDYEEIDNAREEWAVKMLKSFGETPATINDQKETFGDLAWDEACRWLSRRLMEGGK